MTTYITVTETAVLIRKALKESFPSIKFSVRSSSYAGGASIRVKWTDGPTSDQVESITSGFAGSYFDGSIDYQGSVYAMLDGKQVRFGANFVFCDREFSDVAIASAIGRVFRKLDGNFERDGIALPTVAQFRKGELYSVMLSGLHSGRESVQSEVNVALARHTYTLTKRSPTAGRAFVTHDDGYSRQCGAGHSAVAPD